MYSIKNKLVKSLTVIISIILLVIFLTLDFVVDDWVDQQFDDALIDKSNYIKSLVEVEKDSIKFEYHQGFMPQFERKHDAQFFQIWSNGKTFNKSNSLSFYKNRNLIHKKVAINENVIFDVILPDGNKGRALATQFQPRFSSEFNKNEENNIGTMSLTLMISNQKVSNILLFVDIALWFVFITAIFGMRAIVIKIVDRELESLYLLNKEIAQLSANAEQIKTNPKESKEIAPIRKELNRYLKLNAYNLENEKRLSSDIAHELKTPIAEIIGLSEMNIRYPDDIRIAATYSADVLSIANNMKNIVNQLMSLHHCVSDNDEIKKQRVDVISLITTVENEYRFKYPDIEQRLKVTSKLLSKHITVDRFSLETVLKNLLDNALFYSLEKTQVLIELSEGSHNRIIFEIKNRPSIAISQEHIDNMFKPLYQIDKSRTHNDRHGLGLSIVKQISQMNDFLLAVDYVDNGKIIFKVEIPKF